MTFSFDKRLAKGASKPHLLGHVFVRACVLYLLGMILTGFPNLRLITPYILAIAGLELAFLEPRQSAGGAARNPWMVPGWVLTAIAVLWFVVDFKYFNGPTRRSSFSDWFPLTVEGGSPIRVVGVLQRIAMCYVAASLIMVATGPRGRLAWSVGLVAAYWIIMKFVDAPAGYAIGAGVSGITVDAPPTAPFPGRLNDWIDTTLLGRHLYSHRPDPEGLLSTIPAVATVLLGTLCGAWIQAPNRPRERKAALMFITGVAFIWVGELLGLWFPINKKIWTSSYVVSMAGWASAILAICYYLMDVRGWKWWAPPFLALGTNAILAFFGSGLMARLLSMIKWGEGDAATNLKSWSYGFYTGAFGAGEFASMAWALSFVALWVLLMVPLYRKKIFLKV
jgi:predicted acyltransferase